MSYNKNNIKELFKYFYYIVDNIIYDIHINKKLFNDLFYCKYDYFDKDTNNYKIVNFPLTFCLGGGGYVLYKNIFNNEGLNHDINLETYDYDISFCFNNRINKDRLEKINKIIIDICKEKI